MAYGFSSRPASGGEFEITVGNRSFRKNFRNQASAVVHVTALSRKDPNKTIKLVRCFTPGNEKLKLGTWLAGAKIQ